MQKPVVEVDTTIAAPAALTFLAFALLCHVARQPTPLSASGFDVSATA